MMTESPFGLVSSHLVSRFSQKTWVTGIISWKSEIKEDTSVMRINTAGTFRSAIVI